MISATADTDSMATTAYVEEVNNDWRRFRSVFPEFKGATVENLQQLRNLQPGWDASNAQAIDQDIIDAAIQLVKKLPDYIVQRPLVAPLSDGELQIEWHRGRKVLEFEFESVSTIHYLKWDPDAQIEEEGAIPATDVDAATNLLDWFMETQHHE